MEVTKQNQELKVKRMKLVINDWENHKACHPFFRILEEGEKIIAELGPLKVEGL